MLAAACTGISGRLSRLGLRVERGAVILAAPMSAEQWLELNGLHRELASQESTAAAAHDVATTLVAAVYLGHVRLLVEMGSAELVEWVTRVLEESIWQPLPCAPPEEDVADHLLRTSLLLGERLRVRLADAVASSLANAAWSWDLERMAGRALAVRDLWLRLELIRNFELRRCLPRIRNVIDSEALAALRAGRGSIGSAALRTLAAFGEEQDSERFLKALEDPRVASDCFSALVRIDVAHRDRYWEVAPRLAREGVLGVAEAKALGLLYLRSAGPFSFLHAEPALLEAARADETKDRVMLVGLVLAVERLSGASAQVQVTRRHGEAHSGLEFVPDHETSSGLLGRRIALPDAVLGVLDRGLRARRASGAERVGVPTMRDMVPVE